MTSRRSSRHGAARQRPNTFARVRALLAGALVLGVGATMTLAAWTDQEYATATITAGTFGLESQTAATAWGNHSSTAASLSFPDASGLYPGQTRSAWFQVRTVAGSIQGNVALTSVNNGAAGVPSANPNLALWSTVDVRIGTVATTEACTTGFSSTSTLYTAKMSAAIPSPQITMPLAANAAGIVTYCVQITLPANAPNNAQGGVVTPTWEFTGSTPTS